MNTKTVTVSQFVANWNVDYIIENLGTIDSPWINKGEKALSKVTHYKVTLKRDDKKMTLSYYCGLACERPTIETILDTLRSDFESVIMPDWNKLSFNEWASEMGYDSDSRQAEKTYKSVLHQSNRLMNLLTNEKAVMPIAPISELLNIERL